MQTCKRRVNPVKGLTRRVRTVQDCLFMLSQEVSAALDLERQVIHEVLKLWAEYFVEQVADHRGHASESC